MPDTILALDLASNVGWCSGAPGGVPTYGSFRIGAPGWSIGGFAVEYNRLLMAHIAMFKPTTLIFEAPILKNTTAGGKAGTSIDVARKLMGLAWHTEFCASLSDIPCYEATPSDVAQYFIGRNSWPGGREEKKRRTIEACQALGFQPKDDDAADSIALWHFLWWKLQPKAPPKRWLGPLLGVSP